MSEIDYNTEYKNFLRCPSCNRKTNGENDFKSLKCNSKTVKTCNKCRISVRNSMKKKPEIYITRRRERRKKLKKPLTQKQKIILFDKLIEQIDKKTLLEILEKNEEFEPILKKYINS